MPEPVRCSNCGGIMTAPPDGQIFTCPYCRTQIQVGITADQIAQGMGLDLANVDNFLSHLANTLYQGFNEHTRIEANGSFVLAIEVNLEPDVFMVRREGKHAQAQHRKVVRGIALRTKELPLDQWVDMLLDALARHANTNARAAWVLGQFGGGRR